MSDVSKINAAAYADKNKLGELITIGSNGIYNIPEMLHTDLVLTPAGITPEQHKKMQKAEAELLGGVLYVGGNLAVEHFKENAEAVEVGFTYNQGSMTTVSGVFNREAKDHTVVAIETKYKTADVKRVLSYLGDHFSNVNS